MSSISISISENRSRIHSVDITLTVERYNRNNDVIDLTEEGGGSEGSGVGDHAVIDITGGGRSSLALETASARSNKGRKRPTSSQEVVILTESPSPGKRKKATATSTGLTSHCPVCLHSLA